MSENTQETLNNKVLFELHGNIAVVTLNHPKARNALDDEMRSQLITVIERVAIDPSIKAMILTGAGSAFCAGGNIRDMKARLAADPGKVGINGWLRQRRVHHAVLSLHTLEKPVIAAVNGPAAGIGCDLALAADFIIASEMAQFHMSYVLRGLIPDGGGLYFLPRRVGLSRAKELYFAARSVDAKEALEINLVDRLETAEALLEKAKLWAAELTKGSGAAIALTKAIINRSLESSLEEIGALGAEAQGICYGTDEHRQAIEAFLGKEK